MDLGSLEPCRVQPQIAVVRNTFLEFKEEDAGDEDPWTVGATARRQHTDSVVERSSHSIRRDLEMSIMETLRSHLGPQPVASYKPQPLAPSNGDSRLLAPRPPLLPAAPRLPLLPTEPLLPRAPLLPQQPPVALPKEEPEPPASVVGCTLPVASGGDISIDHQNDFEALEAGHNQIPLLPSALLRDLADDFDHGKTYQSLTQTARMNVIFGDSLAEKNFCHTPPKGLTQATPMNAISIGDSLAEKDALKEVLWNACEPQRHPQDTNTCNQHHLSRALPTTTKGPSPQLGACTTAMIRNVPPKYTQAKFMREVNGMGFLGQYDFLYLPMDMRRRTNRGFAFVNFNTPEITQRFHRTCHGKHLPLFPSEKPLEVAPADIQGFEANAHHYLTAKDAKRGRDSCTRPVFLRSIGDEEHCGHNNDADSGQDEFFSKEQIAPRVKPQAPAPIAAATWSSSMQPPAGTSAPQRFCSYCGQPKRPEHRFCPYCGAKVCGLDTTEKTAGTNNVSIYL